MSNGIFGGGIGVYRPGTNSKVYPPNWRLESRPPTQNDNQDVVVGDFWMDLSNLQLTPPQEPTSWVLVALYGDSTSKGSLAHWVQFTGSDLQVHTLTGDDGIPVAPVNNNIDLLATPNAGSTVRFNANLPGELDLKVTDSNFNTIVGLTAGNNAIATANCTGLGYNVFHALTTGSSSTAVGSASQASTTSGLANNSLGSSSLNALTTGSANVALGTSSQLLNNGSQNVTIGNATLNSATASSYNIIAGHLGGSAYTTNESSNILLGNVGTIADNNTIRIGTQGSGAGQQNRFFAAGIDGVSLGNTSNVVTEVGGQLGTATITAGTGIALNLTPNVIEIEATGSVTGNPVAFTALINAENNVTGDGTDFALGAVTAMTTLQNVSGSFFPGDGAGTPASFTAPVDGTYALTFTLATSIPVGGGLVQGWSMYLNGAGFNAVSQLPTSNQVAGFQGTNGFIDASGAIITPLTAGDIITWVFTATGGAKTASTAVGYVGGALLGTLNNGGGANSFPTDSGNATPLAGVLNIVGGTGINTSGAGNTVTVNADVGSVSFAAYLSATAVDVTGDGTLVTVPYNATSFNNGSGFNVGTNTFTAPVAGIYQFNVVCEVEDIDAAMTSVYAEMVISGTSYPFLQMNGANIFVPGGSSVIGFSGSTLVNMALNDTAIVRFEVGGSTRTVDILGGLGNNVFSGYLVR